MTVRRSAINRIISARLSGGAAGALGRRTGKTVPERVVVEAPWEQDTTPVIDLLKAIKPSTQEFRSTDNIHVSDIISKCVRKIALMRRLNLRHPQEQLMDGHAITFAIGDAIHDYIKGRFVKGHPDKVHAKWACLCGKEWFVGLFKDRPRKQCDHCSTAPYKYNEIRITDSETKLTGSPDLLLWLEELGAYYIVEIKSAAAETWKEMVRAEPNHKVQVSLYWWLLQRAGMPVVNRTSVLYTNKEFSFKFPYKEFVVDPHTVDLSPYMEDLEKLADALKGGELPPRIMCGGPDAPEAKKCPVRVTCFGC